MIEVDLSDLEKRGKEISQLLEEKLRTGITVKGRRLILLEKEDTRRFSIKEVKSQLKNVLHSLGFSDRYRILVDRQKIRIVKKLEKSRLPVQRKGTVPSAPRTLPYFFP